MLQKAESPPPEAITPYRRALVINRYKIKEARDSQLVNQTVQVAEWALLDAKIPSTYADAKPGEVLELNLEPYEAHPQLESERLASDMPSLEEELYYSVSSGVRDSESRGLQFASFHLLFPAALAAGVLCAFSRASALAQLRSDSLRICILRMGGAPLHPADVWNNVARLADQSRYCA